MRQLSIIAVLFLAGCSGMGTNAALRTTIESNVADAQAAEPFVIAGTANADNCMAIVAIAGDRAETVNASVGPAADVLFGKKGVYFTDAHYVPAFDEIVANCIALSHAAKGRWQTSPPSLTYLLTAAENAIWSTKIIDEMRTATTTQVPTAGLPVPVATKKLRATTMPTSLAGMIADKLPASWQKWYDSLPAATRQQVDADIPLITGWAVEQVLQWAANWQNGNPVAARVMVLDAQGDEGLAASSTAANVAGATAVNNHVKNNVALIAGIEGVLGSLIPAILGAVGL